MNGYYIKRGSCTNISITRLHAFQRARAHACMASYFIADVRPVFMAMASQILMEMPMHLCWKMKKQQLIKFRNQECFSHLTDLTSYRISTRTVSNVMHSACNSHAVVPFNSG